MMLLWVTLSGSWSVSRSVRRWIFLSVGSLVGRSVYQSLSPFIHWSVYPSNRSNVFPSITKCDKSKFCSKSGSYPPSRDWCGCAYGLILAPLTEKFKPLHTSPNSPFDSPTNNQSVGSGRDFLSRKSHNNSTSKPGKFKILQFAYCQDQIWQTKDERTRGGNRVG